MCFEVRQRDLMARLGVVETKKGRFETPALLPVVNPAIQLVSPAELKELFGFDVLITNAYIIMRHFGREAVEKGIHELLGFDGVVATDSGAYQLLVYGHVEVRPDEVVAYQEAIGSDIATILDVPTGWASTRGEALRTVIETAERGERLWSMREREDVLWVGPIQGGRFTDLVAYSARLMGSMPFDIHALGSPTPVMEAYRFDVLVDMVMAARLNTPPDRPLHLFGAGHPMTFSLAVALGCDMFDSAAYAIYARDGRYMMENGTYRLEELNYFPCSCPVCARREPSDLLEMPKEERERLLALHNLYVCSREVRAIRQAIREGSLWEHLSIRSRSHPSLARALKKLACYSDIIEKCSPTSRKKGIFIFSPLDMHRPEVVRFKQRLLKRFKPPSTEILLLMPYTTGRPFSRSREHDELLGSLAELGMELAKKVHVCLFGLPFGIVPLELDQLHPLSQHEFSGPEEGFSRWAIDLAVEYVREKAYGSVVLVSDGSPLAEGMKEALGKTCSSIGSSFSSLNLDEPWSGEGLRLVVAFLSDLLRGER